MPSPKQDKKRVELKKREPEGKKGLVPKVGAESTITAVNPRVAPLLPPQEEMGKMVS